MQGAILVHRRRAHRVEPWTEPCERLRERLAQPVRKRTHLQELTGVFAQSAHMGIEGMGGDDEGRRHSGAGEL